MPRKARIDAPGALHHVIVREIERRKIFRSDYDWQKLLDRFGELILETQTHCFAWALIPNHKKVWHEKDIESLGVKKLQEKIGLS